MFLTLKPLTMPGVNTYLWNFQGDVEGQYNLTIFLDSFPTS